MQSLAHVCDRIVLVRMPSKHLPSRTKIQSVMDNNVNNHTIMMAIMKYLGNFKSHHVPNVQNATGKLCSLCTQPISIPATDKEAEIGRHKQPALTPP